MTFDDLKKLLHVLFTMVSDSGIRADVAKFLADLKALLAETEKPNA